MHKTQLIMKKLALSMIVLMQIVFYPAAALAAADPISPSGSDPAGTTTAASSTPPPVESAPAATNEPTPPPVVDPTPAPAPGATGPAQPTGSDSSTYVYNDATGLWENDLYTWNPTTHQTIPKTAQDYSYNPTTKLWDTTQYYYSPEAGKYLPNVVSSSVKPVAGTATSTPKSATSTPLSLNSIGGTGPSSNNKILLGGNTTGTYDGFFDARISNAIGQMSHSGNASVQGNTTGGSSLSGDSESIANILNLLQSSWGTLGSDDISSFVANVDGNMVGDLFIDPSQISSGSGNTKINVNVAKNGLINNDINLDAQSGSASVQGNTTGGSAVSGDAHAVANLMNLINSAITAKKSFVGVLNINGDLEGDILLPPGLLQNIIASSGPNSNNTIRDSGNTNLDVNVGTNRSITNDVNADAASGNASVNGNTSGGTATSGKSQTNVTLLNLTGRTVVAKNALLVFVNVFGKWVGLIMNAPEGSNAVAATGPGSTNTIDSQHNTDVNVKLTENSQIRNNVRTAAHSGSASVQGNTIGGDATSGDASAGANVLNLIDSNFTISDWFGVLFINVFGTWHGSFGVDTPYGNRTNVSSTQGATPPSSATGATNATLAGIPGTPKVFSFVPRFGATASPKQGDPEAQVESASTTSVANTSERSPIVNGNAAAPNPHTGSSSASLAGLNLTWTFSGLATAVTLLGLERFLTLRRRI